MEAVVEVVPPERVQNRILEQTVDSPVPQLLEAVVESCTTGACVQNRIRGADHGGRLASRASRALGGNRTPRVCSLCVIPPCLRSWRKACQFVPQERVQNRTPEFIVDCPRASDHGGRLASSYHRSAMQNRYAGADRGCPSCLKSRRTAFQVYHKSAMQNRFPEQIMDSPVPQLMEAVVEVIPQEHVQNRFLEQIADTPVPQIIEAVVEVLPSTPQECVQNRTPEQIVDFPVPQIMEECVQNRTQEQIMDSRVPQIMEAVVEVLPSTPQECVQNHTSEQIVDFPVSQIVQESVQNRTLELVRVQSRIQEQIMDLPVPQIMAASKPYTGKVFTVEMPHEHVHQAYPGDYVVFNIKGLDKHNMPRSGDVMVPASQIQEQTFDDGGSGIVREIPEEKVVERTQDSTAFVGAQHGPLHESRSEESSMTFCGGAGPRRGQRGQPLPPERVAERLARIDALLAQVSLDEEEEEVMEEEIPEVQVSRFQGVFRPRRLCPNLLRGSRCHYGNRCTFAHAFHELADEGWYVPGSTANW